MTHAQRFKVIGLCDAKDKFRGKDGCVHFRDEHVFFADHIPTESAMREYAGALGYFPRKMRGTNPGQCQPIYHVIGEGLDYLQCDECAGRAEKREAA